MSLNAKRAIVHGRVQGVGFRFFVQREAQRLGLAGSVRNQADSTVEVVVQGHQATLEQFLEVVRVGPSHARVAEVEVDDIPIMSKKTFTIEGW